MLQLLKYSIQSGYNQYLRVSGRSSWHGFAKTNGSHSFCSGSFFLSRLSRDAGAAMKAESQRSRWIAGIFARSLRSASGRMKGVATRIVSLGTRIPESSASGSAIGRQIASFTPSVQATAWYPIEAFVLNRPRLACRAPSDRSCSPCSEVQSFSFSSRFLPWLAAERTGAAARARQKRLRSRGRIRPAAERSLRRVPFRTLDFPRTGLGRSGL